MQFNHSRQKQEGAALAISLIILLILTIVVLSSNQSTLVQEKMSAAVREGHVTLSLAESGIVEAEEYLENLAEADFINEFNATGDNGLYVENTGPDDIYNSNTWLDTNTQQVMVAVALPDGNSVNTEVKYFIQSLGRAGSGPITDDINVINYGEDFEIEDSNVFRIVALATGTNSDAERVIVTYFGKTF